MTAKRATKYVPLEYLRTNELDIKYQLDEFLSQCTVVSYRMCGDWYDDKYRNLAYSQLKDLPVISVVGMFVKLNTGSKKTFHRFFVLTSKDSAQKVINTLRCYEAVKVGEDNLQEYDENTRKRILAALAINSIAKVKAGRKMYHDGSLLIVNDDNFGFNEKRKGLVCLCVKVSDDLHLVGQTATFSHPWNYKEFKNPKYRALKVGKDLEGAQWFGRSLNPVEKWSIPETQFNSDNYFIPKAKWADNKNTIPYWPYNKDKYLNGKLFILSEILKSVNDKFAGMLSIAFREHKVVTDDNYSSRKATESLLAKELHSKKIYFDNDFKDSGSAYLIEEIKREADNIVDGLSWTDDLSDADMVISLCPPPEEDNAQNGNQMYMKALVQKDFHHTAVQHVIYDSSENKGDLKPYVRRCLIDLMVKYALSLHDIPQEMANITSGWSFALYKIEDSYVNGSVAKIDGGKLTFTDMGLSKSDRQMFEEEFNKNCLYYDGNLAISGQQHYHVIKKDGNVYLIIYTDEIPMLDADVIDQAYDEIRQNDESVSKFKRAALISKYLGPFVGFHLWETDNHLAPQLPAFSYLVGLDRGYIEVSNGKKIDRMPRARHVMALHLEHPEKFEDDRNEFIAMLKFGLARWNEMMTYPVAFKFLEEHLDAVSLRSTGKHWRDTKK